MTTLDDLEKLSANPHVIKALGLPVLISYLQEACAELRQEVKAREPNNNTLRWIKVIQELAGYLNQTPIYFFKIPAGAGE